MRISWFAVRIISLFTGGLGIVFDVLIRAGVGGVFVLLRFQEAHQGGKEIPQIVTHAVIIHPALKAHPPERSGCVHRETPTDARVLLHCELVFYLRRGGFLV